MSRGSGLFSDDVIPVLSDDVSVLSDDAVADPERRRGAIDATDLTTTV
ncbi:hypothetical protein ACFO5R_12850 [Halosolutus amylolyticus]|uniref:Uncharacterized protein n=1 Tax=Halosolutus amylolyticus TaxID=2932267 RepID=A0ABD5PQB8_9EURY|nr:hypothetical protein [Halosolutus amylolyticus]